MAKLYCKLSAFFLIIRHSFLIGAASAAAVLFLLSPPAQAAFISNGIFVTVTAATGGNPVNAVVGLQGAQGNVTYGDGDLTGSGEESLPIRSPGESLTLPIGDEVFIETDDAEFTFAPDIPSAEFQDGLIFGLDLWVFFNFDGGGNLITKQFDSDDLGQDTSGFIDDFELRFEEGSANFTIAQITGFVESADNFGIELVPVTGSPLVSGNLTFIPEPSSAILLGFGLLAATGISRRITARRS